MEGSFLTALVDPFQCVQGQLTSDIQFMNVLNKENN